MSFGSIISYSIYNIDIIKASSMERRISLANEELQNIINSIQNDLNNTATLFSNWEEAKQQLDNPTYYAYWHKSRMPSATFLPVYFKNAELYGNDGFPLSTSEVSILQLTERLKHENIYINPQKNTIYQIRQIRSDGEKIKGYVIIEYSLNEVFSRLSFQYIDKNSIGYRDNSSTFPLNKLQQHMVYSLNTNEAFNSLQAVLFSTILHVSIVGALISVTLWIIISIIAGKPLTILARHIDSIEYGNFKKLEQHLHPLQVTREYETVRESFNRFQELLHNSDDALKLSESRLQAVVENIRIGILTFDENLVIDSCNAEALKIFGYLPDEIQSMSFNQLFDKEAQQVIQYHADKLIHSDFISTANNEIIEVKGISNNSELLELSLSMNKVQFAGKHLLLAMIRDIASEKRASEKLELMANFDGLTSLPNRVLFHDRLIHAIEQTKRKQNILSLMFLDLDRFKYINDTLGHHIGDLLLVQAAKRIRECTRECDTVARLGGDEFTVINEDISSTEETVKVATRINEALRLPFEIEGQEHFISTSIGITFYPKDANDAEELIKHADAAMYKAKDLGGDGYQMFTSDISDNTNQRMLLENQLRHAIENQEFELFYQPRIHLHSQEITSFEALLRWNNKGKHRASPAEFIPILEDTGMIINVGNWVLNEACIQINHWQKNDLDFKRIAINLSGRQFKHKDFLRDIDTILQSHDVRPEQIEFEITESLLIDNVEDSQQLLESLHKRGFHISIDDFGTGYSSLSYLKQFPIDTIKIDQYFLKNYPNDKSDIAIIESIIAIAENLDMSITAEGVENEDQLRFLAGCNCQEAQGFYFARPMPAQTVQAWVMQYKPMEPEVNPD